ncbi:MAG: hypothetical protein PCFJNLEI_01398 [Verrucomicrobiae bacterium]|nr:hypothetical protein [Verrucomicrobiae bacterium]
MVSPFIGGGSVELALAAQGWQVHAYDYFAPLVDFWQVALTDAPSLADVVMKYLPLQKQTFQMLQNIRFTTKLERAAAFFVLNRASFSGSTMSGGMSPGHPRFTASAIQRLRAFKTGDLWVERADFRRSIQDHPNSLLFLDPPYVTAKNLYGRRRNLHNSFDHAALSDLIRHRNRWILCYDDCEQVRQWYDGYTTVPLRWSYGMSADKRGRELLILSHDVAEEWRARGGNETS